MRFLSLSSAFALAVTTVALASEETVSYDGYKVLRIAAGADLKKVHDVIDSLALDTWNNGIHSDGQVDVVIPAGKVPAFEAQTGGMKKTVMHSDLGKSIAKEMKFQPYVAGTANATWFNSYHPYADHLSFLSSLAAQHPNNAEIVTAGNSLQGKPITGIHFYGASGKGVKPAIYLQGTVHAREWIATMVVEYIAYNLLTKYSSDPTIKSYVDKYDFYIFPVVNPDGFVYSQTTNRLWRKNRQSPPSGSSCAGRDINRNFNYKWNVPGGASTDPCADDYRGLAPQDAPETVVLQNFLNTIAKSSQTLKMFIDYHSYSQLFMSPYGYSCTATASNSPTLNSLAAGAAAAIKAVYGTVFQSGPICPTIYQTSGNSVDYVKDISGAPYAFAVELRDTGMNGFVLPPTQILPSGVETFAAMNYLLGKIV